MNSGVTGSPTQKISKQQSKNQLGTIYSSGVGLQNHIQSQSRRQSQFRSSRLYKNYHQTVASNPPMSHYLHNQSSTSDMQSMSTLNANHNQSLEKLPYQKLSIQQIYSEEQHPKEQSPITQTTNYRQNAFNYVVSTTQLQQSKFINIPHKKLSLYQKRLNQKLKMNQASVANISMGDERSTDIQEENSYNNQVSASPYKTLTSFNNMKSLNKTNNKYNQYPYSNYYVNNESIQFNHHKKSKFDQTPESASDRNHVNITQQPLLLLKIEEDNHEVKSRARHITNQKDNSLSKVSSKTEFPELRQTTFKSRLKNNQSINLGRIHQQSNQSNINSQTSSRTQLAQIISSDNRSRFDQLNQNSSKKMSKMNSLRINQDMINNQNIRESNQNQSPQYSTKKDLSMISVNTQSTFQNASTHKIRIEINKEESILNYLTKDHKANMSLLFYDFNNANQRLYSKQRQNLADLVIPEEAEDLPGIISNQMSQNMKIQDDELLLSRQETLLQEIYNGDRPNLTQMKKTATYSISPRKDVEMINQKINNAKRKISRYFAQNNTQGSSNASTMSKQEGIKKNQNSLTHLSIDMVRLGSPFFGTNMQTSIMSCNQNSPMPLKSKKQINNQQSESSLKFSPMKQHLQKGLNNDKYPSIKNEVSRNNLASNTQDDYNDGDFSFHRETTNQSVSSQMKKTLVEIEKISESYSSDDFQEDKSKSQLPQINIKHARDSYKKVSTFEYVKENENLFN